MPLRIVLADHHLICRQGLKSLLERDGFRIVGEAADGREGIRLAHDLSPEAVVLDLFMPILNGLDAAREIFRGSPLTRPILLTTYTEDSYVIEALRAGIKGYVLKTQPAPDLFQAIREVSQGRAYLSPGISRVVVEAYLAKSELSPDPLSPREREVLQLVVEGKTTREAARLLGVRVRTVGTHRERIMKKLDIHETTGLV